jgi:hypothetical protein
MQERRIYASISIAALTFKEKFIEHAVQANDGF